MSEKPILFSGPMVRAIRERRKTQTRRVVKPQPPHGVGRYTEDGRPGEVDWVLLDEDGDPTGSAIRCPYGAPGDRLWVRETWAWDPDWEGPGSVHYRATHPEGTTVQGRWRPSIHMPRWASRITLDVVSVRVERLQDITEAAIEAEGVTCQLARELAPGACVASPFDAWRILWDPINGKRPGCSWADDPWVWVVEFRRVAP